MKKNDQPQCSHLLQREGIIKNFSIRRKVSDEELKKLYAKIRASCKSNQEAQRKMEQSFQIKNMSIIPGIIVPTNKEKRNREIEEYAEGLAEFIAGNKMSPKEIQHFLNLAAYLASDGDDSFFDGCEDDDEEDE